MQTIAINKSLISKSVKTTISLVLFFSSISYVSATDNTDMVVETIIYSENLWNELDSVISPSHPIEKEVKVCDPFPECQQL